MRKPGFATTTFPSTLDTSYSVRDFVQTMGVFERIGKDKEHSFPPTHRAKLFQTKEFPHNYQPDVGP